MKLDMPNPAGAVNLDDGSFSQEWVAFLTKITNDAVWRGRFGTTAQRPTNGLEVGTPFFDQSLGKPVWVKTPAPAPAVWVDATGAVV